MDRPLLIASTLCYLTAVVRTLLAVRDRIALHGRFNFFAIGVGFLFQTAFLSVRGHALGRCPLTNLFEVFVFLAWSVALIYLAVGPTYRLSLMGAFTAPLVFALQTFALLAPIDVPHQMQLPAEFLAGISRVDFDDCLRRLCPRLRGRRDVPRAGAATQNPSVAFDFLSSAAADESLRRADASALAWFCALYRRPRQRVLYRRTLAAGEDDLRVWRLGFLRRDFAGPASALVCAKRVAALCVLAFSAAISVLWAINFVSQSRPM